MCLNTLHPEEKDIINKIFINPFNAKGLMMALKDMVSEYEDSYGELQHPEMERVKKEDKEMEDKDFRAGFIA